MIAQAAGHIEGQIRVMNSVKPPGQRNRMHQPVHPIISQRLEDQSEQKIAIQGMARLLRETQAKTPIRRPETIPDRRQQIAHDQRPDGQAEVCDQAAITGFFLRCTRCENFGDRDHREPANECQAGYALPLHNWSPIIGLPPFRSYYNPR